MSNYVVSARGAYSKQRPGIMIFCRTDTTHSVSEKAMNERDIEHLENGPTAAKVIAEHFGDQSPTS